MNNFTFHSPTEFVFGEDVENNTGELAKKYGADSVLVVYGGNSAKKSGLLDRVVKSLEDEDIKVTTIGGVVPNPRADKVYEGIELARDNDVDLVLGVGGGSTIDTAKAIALGTPFEGDFWDIFEGKVTEFPQPLPVGTVLTIAAAGSEGSNSAVIQKDGEKIGLNCEEYRPRFSMLNPALTQTLPPYQTAAGITDMMAHIMERYFTTTKDVQVTDEMAEALLRSIVTEAPKVIENPDDYQARANLMWAGMLAHNDIVGVGREQDWTSHHLEHELSALYDVAHGAGLAVIFPAWMEYMMDEDVERFAKFAHNVFGVPLDTDNLENTAKAGIRALRDFFHSIGMPLGFEDLGAKKEDIGILVEELAKKYPTQQSLRELDSEDAEKIYEIAADYVY